MFLLKFEITIFSYLKLAACDDKNNIFNSYTVPSTKFSKEAKVVTGLQTKGGELFLRGKKVATLSLSQMFEQFFSYLMSLKSKYDKSGDPCKIIMLGHNILR